MYKPNKTLLEAVAATIAGSFTFTIPLQHSQLVKDGMLEVNPEIVDPNGKGIATRATDAGIAAVNAWNAQEQTAPVGEPKTKPLFVLEDAVPMPPKTRSSAGGHNSKYPFDEMLVGQSFFVPNTADKPNAAKSMATTVSGANARYTEVVPGEFKTNRKGATVPKTKPVKLFEVRPVDGGCRVWRTL